MGKEYSSFMSGVVYIRKNDFTGNESDLSFFEATEKTLGSMHESNHKQ